MTWPSLPDGKGKGREDRQTQQKEALQIFPVQLHWCYQHWCGTEAAV